MDLYVKSVAAFDIRANMFWRAGDEMGRGLSGCGGRRVQHEEMRPSYVPYRREKSGQYPPQEGILFFKDGSRKSGLSGVGFWSVQLSLECSIPVGSLASGHGLANGDAGNSRAL